MTTQEYIILTLSFLGGFTLVGMTGYMAYRLGLVVGADRERKRRDLEVLDRAMERVRRLAEEAPDLWETEIDV